MTLSTKLDFPMMQSRRRASAGSARSVGGHALRDPSVPSVKIHKLSDVQTIDIGDGTSVWQYVVILPNAKIGRNCNICSHVFIENDCIIADDVTIKNNVMVYDGVEIGRGAFIGPSVTFTNDLYPRSARHVAKPYQPLRTIVETGAAIGANTVVKCGVRIGAYAMVGAGSVVTRDVPPYALVYGNPARIAGKVARDGTPVA